MRDGRSVGPLIDMPARAGASGGKAIRAGCRTALPETAAGGVKAAIRGKPQETAEAAAAHCAARASGAKAADSRTARPKAAEVVAAESVRIRAAGPESTRAESTRAESAGAESAGLEAAAVKSTGLETAAVKSTAAKSTGVKPAPGATPVESPPRNPPNPRANAWESTIAKPRSTAKAQRINVFIGRSLVVGVCQPWRRPARSVAPPFAIGPGWCACYFGSDLRGGAAALGFLS